MERTHKTPRISTPITSKGRPIHDLAANSTSLPAIQSLQAQSKDISEVKLNLKRDGKLIALADDLLIGANAIASYCCAGWNRRKIYYLAAKCNFPIIKGAIGARYCARKSSIDAWFALHENKKFKELCELALLRTEAGKGGDK